MEEYEAINILFLVNIPKYPVVAIQDRVVRVVKRLKDIITLPT